jgi:hypothetical protein
MDDYKNIGSEKLFAACAVMYTADKYDKL